MFHSKYLNEMLEIQAKRTEIQTNRLKKLREEQEKYLKLPKSEANDKALLALDTKITNQQTKINDTTAHTNQLKLLPGCRRQV